MSISGSAMPRCMVSPLSHYVIARREVPKQSRAACTAPGLLRRFAPRNDDSNNLLPDPRDRFEVALVLAGEAQHEMRAAGAHVFVEPFGDARCGPGVAHLPFAQHRGRLAVIAFE